MSRQYKEAVGIRRTGWAALNRDPQEDKIEFACPNCAAQGMRTARRERALYHFVDGFLQDEQGEVVQCGACRTYVRIVPVVMLHNQEEARRFEAVFSEELAGAAH